MTNLTKAQTYIFCTLPKSQNIIIHFPFLKTFKNKLKLQQFNLLLTQIDFDDRVSLKSLSSDQNLF